jgi:hypothetical protein
MRLVAVHGVGNPPVGSILSSLAQHPRDGRYTTFTRTSLIVAGQEYAIAESEDNRSTILEVNWADLRRPMRNPIGVLKHLLLLMSAMLTVPVSLCRRGTLAFRFLVLYAAVFETFIFWVLFVPVLTMLVVTSRTSGIAVTIGVCGALLLAAISFIFCGYSSRYRAGYIWAGSILIIAGIVSLHHGAIDHGAVKALIIISSRLYVSAQVVLGILLAFCFYTLLRRRDLDLQQRVSHFALLYLPFALLSGLGALLWSAALSLPKKEVGHLFNSSKFESWGNTFLNVLHYDLRPVELMFTIAIGSMGVFALVVAALYFARARSETISDGPTLTKARRPRDPGLAAQNAVGFLLYVIPFLLLVAGVFFSAELFAYQKPLAGKLAHYVGTSVRKTSLGTEVLNVYLKSALRLVPFLGFMVGPLTIIVDVIGDVVFFLAAGAFSIQQEAVTRVRTGLLALSSRKQPIIVLCHSQGTILVRQALASMETEGEFSVVSIGCPLDSIYGRFLGWRPQGTLSHELNWLNGFRSGDYIGGDVKEASNWSLGGGGHTSYWSDPRVWPLIYEAERIAVTDKRDQKESLKQNAGDSAR